MLLNSEDELTDLKLSDFGISKIVSKDSEFDTFCGTHGYKAPEISIESEKLKYTNKVDVWSSGAVLYFMLSGPGLAGSAPSALRIEGCDSFPCHVGHLIAPSHGHDFYYEVDFEAHHSSQTLELTVYQTAFGQTVQVELPDDLRNACNGLVGANCPVNSHQALTHGANIEGEGDLHGGIPAQMRIEITDDDHICMCTLINIIVD